MAANDYCLIIFAKEPVPGQVKTRLSAALGQERAIQLYKAFLQDTHTLTSLIPVPFRILAYESFGGMPNFLYSTFPHFMFYPQHGNDLGMRIEDTLLYAKHLGAKRVIIIGSDSPTLPPELITESFTRLEKYDVVLGPCKDGGFYLLGINVKCQEVFQDISWGEEKVFKQMRENVAARGYSYYTLCDWYDIDRAEDLKDLMKKKFSSSARSTAEVIQEISREDFRD